MFLLLGFSRSLPQEYHPFQDEEQYYQYDSHSYFHSVEHLRGENKMNTNIHIVQQEQQCGTETAELT